MSDFTKDNEAESLDDRFLNLETLITYQEQQIDTLTKNYQEQQKQLFKMEKELNRMKDIVRSMQVSSIKSSGDETPPPHY